MPQDRESGAAAAEFGHAMGRALARLLGARLIRNGSNEVDWEGRRAVIKTCRVANTSFGITTAMLDRLDVALVAIEDDDGGYDVHELPIERFRSNMRDSRSGRANGSVKIVARREAEINGRLVARFSAGDFAANA